MQYRKDARSGNELSALGFGCMRFPRGRTMQTDTAATERLIVEAVERGVNYFDTAYIYPGSEEIFGDILARTGLRDRVFIATKLPLQKCHRTEDFDALFATQLERLRTDHVDYYLMHNLSGSSIWESLCGLGIERWLAEKKASGAIRNVGFSFHGTQGEFLKLLDMYDWDFCQIQYNYMNENYQAGKAGLKRASEKGLPVIIMEPNLGGKLASGLPKRAEEAFRAADSKRTPASWSFRWLWNQPEVTVVLSGMDSLAQLEDNCDTAEDATVGALSERELAVYEPVRAAFRETYKVPCTGCNYCMPCPQGVNIPGCFAAYNMSFAVGLVSGLQQYITSIGATDPRKNYSARRCVKCGKCEKQCPQHIEISKHLEAVGRRMEPWWLRAGLKVALKLMR
ncbi:MAG: aldo/keto reductase [Oscillospiraceae bacterium]|nr:aldo/keto reductase [Oscillospiraceae bacterium]